MLLVLCDWTDLWSTDPVADGRQGVGALVGEIAVVGSGCSECEH